MRVFAASRAVALLFAASALAQAPQVVATFTWNDHEGAVTTDDVALEIVPRHRRTPRGEEAIAHLVDLHIVRSAAEGKGLMPSPQEVAKQVADYREAIKAQGRDPDQFLASKGVSLSELTDYTVLTMALDRLVVQQLGLKDASGVTNEYRELWLRDAKKAAEVVTDEATLPAGIVARTGDRQFTLLELGRVMSARSKATERKRFARQIILRRILEAEAKASGIAPSKADCEAAVRRIRERAEAEKGGEIAFHDMLQAFGTTPAELIESPVLKAQVLARQLIAARHPEAEVRARLQADASDVAARYGARRHLEVLWLRASATPNPLIPRSFAAATTEAEELRSKLDSGTTFALLARVHSDDPRTKLKGGDTGWHHRASKTLPEEVLTWAYGAKQGDISAPIQVADGVCLVRVTAIEPDPPLAVIRSRLLDDMEEAYYRELLDKAQVKFQEGE